MFIIQLLHAITIAVQLFMLCLRKQNFGDRVKSMCFLVRPMIFEIGVVTLEKRVLIIVDVMEHVIL